jgi:hypothetical protein
MNTLLLLDDGWAAERVAEVLFIDVETVREHRRLYQASGDAAKGSVCGADGKAEEGSPVSNG